MWIPPHLSKVLIIIAALALFVLFTCIETNAQEYATVSVERANLREVASTNGRVITTVAKGSKVEITADNSSDGKWYRVAVNGRIGWLHKSTVTMANPRLTRDAIKKAQERTFCGQEGWKVYAMEDDDAKTVDDSKGFKMSCYSRDRTSKSGNVVRSWTKIMYLSSRKTESMSLFDVHCKDRTLRLVSRVDYAEDGSVEDSIDVPSQQQEWIFAVPDSIGEQLVDALCK